MMRTSQKGINLIKEFEGCRLKAYKCPAGVWTIGYGHTSNVKPNQSITREEAERLLREDLRMYEVFPETSNPYTAEGYLSETTSAITVLTSSKASISLQLT